MARIVVLGGTGYAGRHIVSEAVSRGHEVISVSRNAPSNPVDGALSVQGSVLDLASLGDVFEGADAVVFALSPRGDMADAQIGALRGVAAKLTGTNTRLGVIGGAMGSLSAPGGPRLWDLGVPEEYRHEAQVGMDTLELLQQSDAGLDWFLVHPPQEFGAWDEGERTGHYRDGGDVVVRDENGRSYISGADFAIAMIDEIEQPKHHRGRFTVGH